MVIPDVFQQLCPGQLDHSLRTMTQLLKWFLVVCPPLAKGKLFLKGAGASSLGDHPFLDLMDLETDMK
jgi:hypothetical protein